MEKDKSELYGEILAGVEALVNSENDEIALLSTVVCRLHHAFSFFWTGFYRLTTPETLKVGPYQGGHGCRTIPFSKGVCGRAATTKQIQLVPNVHECEYHIACSGETNSEIVVPVIFPDGTLHSVLDVDSKDFACFDDIDSENLGRIAEMIGKKVYEIREGSGGEG